MNSLTHFTVKGRLVMSHQEADRISILDKLISGSITEKQASLDLGLSVRQVRRLKKRYSNEGVSGLTHRSRGRRSNHCLPQEEIDKAISLIKKHYHDFGPTLALEKLQENHGIGFGLESLRKVMIKEGLHQPKRRSKARIHQSRTRRSREGELIQLDGSPHDWFEGRISDLPNCDLLVYIDDATGKLQHLEFATAESTNSYFKATKMYLNKHGKPLALYVDRHSVFKTTRTKGGNSGTYDSQKLTQFQRAMKQLRIELIFANTPQAKGRVERVNKTLQDRLVKEMRLRGVSSIQEANKYLPEFIKDFNQRFAVKPANHDNAHRPLLLTEKKNLDRVLARQDVRTLSKNLEFQYENILYQIITKKQAYTLRHSKVLVIRNTDDKVIVYYKDKKLKYKIVEQKTKSVIASSKMVNSLVDSILIEKKKEKKNKKEKKENQNKKQKTNRKPSANHPWRRYPRVRRDRTFLLGKS